MMPVVMLPGCEERSACVDEDVEYFEYYVDDVAGGERHACGGA